MADCEETLRELDMFLDGELSSRDIEHVRRHIDGCMDCLQVFDFHAELKAVIRAKCQEHEVPPGLMERVRACFGEDVAPAPPVVGEPPAPLG